MGLSVDRTTFADEEYRTFGVRLRRCLTALELLLDRPGFGKGPCTIGAEMEMSLVDRDFEALPLNREVLARSLDSRLQLELDRFNLEYNLAPVAAAGTPFTAMQAELDRALAALGRVAAEHDALIVAIGILPTLRLEHLQDGWMTDLPRYHALAAGIQRLRQAAIPIRIDGEEPLEAEFGTVTAEGANTSFQIHLRVDPDQFARFYNAAQLATPLALAAGANSPFLLGHSLWDETRIALFKQAVDTRRHRNAWRRMARVPFGHGWVRRGALELFAEACHLYPVLLPVCDRTDDLAIARAGGMPELAELRLHQGTIWNWNRPVFDAADGGHLRIELRALPAGPTPVDMMANAAYLIGLTAGLAPYVQVLLPAFPFRYADYNFYRAAQLGLGAGLLWPTLDDTSPRTTSAAELCREMLPLAKSGLVSLGVDAAEADRFLAVIERRLDTGTTPATWQRNTLKAHGNLSRDLALKRMVADYLEGAASGRPIAEW